MRVPATILGLGLLAACGGGSHDPGLTDPGQPPPTTTASGTVHFKGAPLAGVSVKAFITNNMKIVGTCTTDAAGAWSFPGLLASGNVPAEYLFWVEAPGYGFYPSLQSGGRVQRSGMTALFQGNGLTDIGMDYTTLEFTSLPGAAFQGADFAAFDGTNPRVALPRTGQGTSAAPGDDGALAKGTPWPAPRFTDGQDGTVTDGVTGLVWLKDAGALGAASWADALAEVNALAQGAAGLRDGSRAGDWRLPNLKELESLVDAGAAAPALTPGHPFLRVAAGTYWTSTSYYGGIGGSSQAWAIRMSDGRWVNDGAANLKTAANAVWAVRGRGPGAVALPATGFDVAYAAGDDGSLQAGAGLPFKRFVDGGDGTVTDTLTGLVWLKRADAFHLTWDAAVAAVALLGDGQYGLTDGSRPGAWRLPNRKEMESLSDRMQTNHADWLDHTYVNLDGSVYQGPVLEGMAVSESYWTSTTDAADPTRAWTLFSCDYGVYDQAKDVPGYALAVRDRD